MPVSRKVEKAVKAARRFHLRSRIVILIKTAPPTALTSGR